MSGGRTPERTLTRRELRALIDAQQADAHDDDDDLFTPADGAAPVPTREPAPHQAAQAVRADEPVVAPKPAGHWTDQLHLVDDDATPYDQVLSRGRSSHGVPTTTNALILPTLPDQGPLGTPLAEGGEIIVTGSIDLPRSYAATGVHPSQVDSSDIDHLFDSDDAATAGVRPVAATSAISTQAGPRTVVAPPKKDGMNLPLILALTAGVLALGVVTTLIVGAVSGLFG
ncbi:hypothetical protein FLP10_17145 [Agromyces intestinalis]|uniref:Uncharacterized protein n=1 Tax=Agromyces intestinalis TaxID=2592652 RepID=A0A5C1YM78_9MICO|nr:hypothetical protein [Agromyces intestinalis]QEO15952.1 hypothetical protein FLP10_17145 [Agromyces intestinalis]